MNSIPKAQVRSRITAENPWWEAPHGILAGYAQMRPRAYLDLLQPLLGSVGPRRAVVLLGPRRVGKTVLIHHAIARLIAQGIAPRRIAYLSVDHPLYTGLGLEDLLAEADAAAGGKLLEGPAHVFFDEIQYLRDWERHLKVLVDGHPDVWALVSGSAAAALRLKSLESGAGRFTDFLLPSLTFFEYLDLLGESRLAQAHAGTGDPADRDLLALNERFVHYLNYGGYPEVLFSEVVQRDPRRFVKSDIIEKVLLRDLPSLYGISDIQELNALFITLAYNTAGEVSLLELSKSAGVAKQTISRYLEYLEAAFLVRIVQRLDRSGKRFQRANFFKVYLTNPSMRSALFSPLGADDEAMGALVESAVFAQHFHAAEHLFYGRWSYGEVDLVRLGSDLKVLSALEVKWSDRFAERPADLKALISFCHANRLRRAQCTTRTAHRHAEVDGVRIDFTPASEHCCAVGAAIIAGRRLEDGT